LMLLRHGRAAAGRSSINIGLQSSPAGVTLSVTDNGVGIAEAQRRSLMQRWVQAGPALVRGQGAGLGLSIVERYANLMHGQLTLAPGPGGLGLQVSIFFARPG
jgi:two-component system, OmpR family, sensor histidine kinase TctE